MMSGLLFCGMLLTGFPAPSEVREVGNQLQPFWDDWLIESLENVRHVLHRPEPREVVLRRDRPWEDHAIYNPVVIRDGYRYRMWYRARAFEKPIYTAYAESLDGIHWVKPNLGLIEHDGSRENNLVWPAPGGKGRSVSVLKDENPEADSRERYKAITNQGTKLPSGREIALLYGLVSPDGLRWRMVQQEPIVVPPLGDGAFDSHNIILWDSVRGHYSIYARGWYRRGSKPLDGKTVGKGPHQVLMSRPSGVVEKVSRIRDIRRFTSKDFRNWSEPVYIGLGDTPLEHLYKNSAVPYYRRPRPDPHVSETVSPHPEVSRRLAATGQSEVVFMFSRDGLNFDRRFMEAFLRPGPNPLNWHERAVQAGPTLVPTAPGEMSLYYVGAGQDGPGPDPPGRGCARMGSSPSAPPTREAASGPGSSCSPGRSSSSTTRRRPPEASAWRSRMRKARRSQATPSKTARRSTETKSNERQRGGPAPASRTSRAALFASRSP